MNSKFEKIETKLGYVKSILERIPETRDNDRELVAIVWQNEKSNLFAFGQAHAVLRAFINKELSNPDDITRARRKVQELNPHLRGKKWVTKQRAVNEADVRENINKVLGGDLFDQLPETLRP